MVPYAYPPKNLWGISFPSPKSISKIIQNENKEIIEENKSQKEEENNIFLKQDCHLEKEEMSILRDLKIVQIQEKKKYLMLFLLFDFTK